MNRELARIAGDILTDRPMQPGDRGFELTDLAADDQPAAWILDCWPNHLCFAELRPFAVQRFLDLDQRAPGAEVFRKHLIIHGS